MPLIRLPAARVSLACALRGLCLLAALAAGGSAFGQGGRGGGPWAPPGAMEPEQRRMMRDEMREHWRQMPPEDRQRLREDRRERWQQMPPEDRQRLREEMRAGGFGGGREGPRGGRH